jgi:Phosphotransferase enzyme family
VLLVDEFGPAFVVKVATTDQSAQAVCREGQLLAALHTSGLGALDVTVPRPLGYVDADGLPALMTGALRGRPMSVDYHAWRHTSRRRTVQADFDAAGDWLAAFQLRTAGPPAPVTMLAQALAVIESRFGPQPELRNGLAGPAQRLACQATPRTVEHGDYWFGNLLIDRGRVVGVVDWEAGRLVGEPLRDVARFAVSYALYLDRHASAGAHVARHPGLRAGGWGAGVAYAVAGRGWFGDLVRDFCSTALRTLGADPACAGDLLLAGIADVAATADHPEFAWAHLQLLLGILDGARAEW